MAGAGPDGRAAGPPECLADRIVRCGVPQWHVQQWPQHHRDRRAACLRGRHQHQQRDALPQLGRSADPGTTDGNGEGVRRAHHPAQPAGPSAVLQQLVRWQQGLSRTELAMAEAILVPGAASGLPAGPVQRRPDRAPAGDRPGRWLSGPRRQRRQGPLHPAQRDQLGHGCDPRRRTQQRLRQRRHHAHVLGGMALDRRCEVPAGTGLPRAARRARCAGQPRRELCRGAGPATGLVPAADGRGRCREDRLCQPDGLAGQRRPQVHRCAACRWSAGQGATCVHEHRRPLVVRPGGSAERVPAACAAWRHRPEAQPELARAHRQLALRS
ncbi:hypothetical protein D3C81_1043480 [compost metagenome]